MNMRVPNSFDTLPVRVQDVPERFRRLNPRTKLAVAVGAAAAILGLLAYFVFGTPGSERPRPPAFVLTAKAAARDVTMVEPANGTVVANATVQVTSQVTGQLMRADFQEGDIVRKGQLLFQIDPKPFEAALQQARATLAKDNAQLVMAQNNKKRYDALFAQNAISPQQRDQSDATTASMVATVAADRAAVLAAELNLGYTQIRSPVDGKTGPILIQPGNLVAANGANPLVVVTQIEPVKISFSLAQSKLARIQQREREGTLRALLSTRDASGKRLSAPVDFVSNQVSNLTGTIELRANFDNRDHRLVPGQQVDVEVTLDTLHKATVVPREAVNEGPNGRYVFVVSKDQIAEMRPVTVLYDEGSTYMAVSGVKPNEQVITDGQLRVLPGAKVSAGHRAAKKS